MNNYNESTAQKVEYKAFPHLFNLVAMRARFKLRSFYNDVSALENKLKKDNDVNKTNKKSLDVLLLRSSSNRNEERKDNNNGTNGDNKSTSTSTCVDSKVLARYYKKTFVDLYKDECAIASKLIASENKVIDYYNKNNFIQFKSNKYKLKPTTNNSNNSNNCSNSTSTVQLAPILSRRNIKPHSHYKPSTVPPSKVIPQLLDNVAHHKRLRTHKSNSLSFFHRYDHHHLNKSTDDIKQQLQGVDKEGNVIDANLAVKPIFKLTTHAMINKGVFRINMTRNQWSNSNGSNGDNNSNSSIRGRKLSEPMEGFNFDYVKFASYDLGMLNKEKIERRYSM